MEFLEGKCIKCKWYFKDHVGLKNDRTCKLEIGRKTYKQIEAIEYWMGSRGSNQKAPCKEA